MGLFLAGCSVFGIRSGTPEPAYQVIGQAGAAEIRVYAPRLAASVTIGGDEIDARAAGFRRLAGFIFGGNTSRAKIEMTAPVAQQSASAKIEMTAPVAQTKSAGGWTITFYMPANYTAATLPKPKDPGIDIHEVPGETVAVLRYSGIPGKTAVAAAHDRLMAALRGSPWHVTGVPVDYFYDPPWTLPWARRNEVSVPVAN
jgi:hypothetical protein